MAICIYPLLYLIIPPNAFHSVNNARLAVFLPGTLLPSFLTRHILYLRRYRPARPPVCRALGFLSYRLAAFSISQVLSLRRAGRVIGSKKETARPAVSYNEFLNYHSLNSDLCISITQIIHFRNLYYPERQTYRLLSHNTTHFVFISLSTLQ